MTTEPAEDNCEACGHDRVFHQIGTGHGVPIGQEFCDDRHDDPCDCAGFVEKQALADFSHITWIAADGDEVDELVPWHVQASPGLLSFRDGRMWVVASVSNVVPTKQMPPSPGAVVARFVVMRETIAPS